MIVKLAAETVVIIIVCRIAYLMFSVFCYKIQAWVTCFIVERVTEEGMLLKVLTNWLSRESVCNPEQIISRSIYQP